MVHLGRIYTRSGDKGETSLGDGTRVRKTCERIVAIGSVDQLNAMLGVTLSAAQWTADVSSLLDCIQNDLFDVGADLCLPVESPTEGRDALRITAEDIERIEGAIDRYNETLAPLTSFVLPGGTVGASQLHLARTQCRRAEVDVLRLGEAEEINPVVPIYLNRLSDLLFVLARYWNHANGTGDVLWQPGGSGE